MPLKCPESDGSNYTTPDGRAFQVECGIDYAGGDMGSLYMNDIPGELWLETCIESCGNMTGCVDISLSGCKFSPLPISRYSDANAV